MSQETILRLALFILLAPLASFVFLIFFHKRLPRSGDWFGTGVLFTLLAAACVVLFEKMTLYPHETLQFTFTWVNLGYALGVGPNTIELGIMVDNLAAIMMVVVAIVSAFVHLFSISYMHGDVRYGRYFAYLSLFTFSMLNIVITNNFFLMYVGWELVGLSSYLLIGHWYEKKSAADAGKKAFIVNRIGDVGMFIGILILFNTFHTFTFDAIFGALKMGELPMGSEFGVTLAGVLIFCGAIGKSAQFPLHVWLPDAMEGPTPVSALIHAATMVAAGVYLVARTFPMMTADALTVIAYVGAITAFIAATIAIAQNDIKKVLAYSTISQLGYMMMGLGVGAFSAGFFHLTTHAMFKAGLFLGSGSVIHAMHHALHHKNDHHTDPQDMRNMGGLRTKMPVTFWTFVMFCLAISGIPLTSGFLSKDEILAGTLAYGNLTGHWLIPIIGFFVAGLTAFYMFRALIMTFMGSHSDNERLNDIHESPAPMTIPLIVFAVLSFFIFYSYNPIGAASGWFMKAVERPESYVPAAVAAASTEVFETEVHHVHSLAMMLSLIVATLGIAIAFVTYYWKKIDADALAKKMSFLYTFLLNKWYFDEFYNGVIVGMTLALAGFLRWIDETIIDGLVNATARWTLALTIGTKRVWAERKFETFLYLTIAAILSIYIGYISIAAIAPIHLSISKMLGYGFLGLAITALAFFMFYAGVGGWDNKVIDGLVNGFAYSAGILGLFVRKIQTGRVQTYIAFVIFGVMVLFIWFF
jgi:NADH-quinone oxidoreductase subunit L